METKNVYNQVNNPTQVNVGSQENSLQTVERRIRETLNSPTKMTEVATSVNRGMNRGLLLGLKLICIPLLVPVIFFTFIGLRNGMSVMDILYAWLSFFPFITGLLGDNVSTFLPGFVILGAGIFCFYLIARITTNHYILLGIILSQGFINDSVMHN